MTQDWRTLMIDDDAGIRDVLERTRAIAVIGAKDRPAEAAYKIPVYLSEQGYRVVPINPTLSTAFGVTAFASLDAVKEPVEMVNVFRASANIPVHADEALRLKPYCFWMQLGIRHASAAEKLARAGIRVVQDRCIYVEHQRLLGGDGSS